LIIAPGLVSLRFAVPTAAEDVRPAAKPNTSAGTAANNTAANTDDGDSKTGKGPKAPGSFTPEREAAALTFVRANHAELADLLERLKQRRPQEYQKAIRELFRASERLAQSQEQQPLRYELELREWKLQSRIQLLVARMSMNRTPELEAELRDLLKEQLGVHRELVEFSYERSAARVAALQKELANLETRRDQLVEERFQAALRSAGQKKSPLKAATAQAKPIEKQSESKPGQGKSATDRKETTDTP
jgi:hypothetical protein